MESKLFSDFVSVVRKLRRECPWDREQTHRSIRHNLIEEAYEAVEAIDRGDFNELKKELGDLLLHVVLHSIMAEEEGKFSIDDVIDLIKKKLIYRHPHIFGDVRIDSAEKVKQNWEKLKQAENKRESIMDGIPKLLPSLLKAYRVQEKASHVGFDWRNIEDVWKKVEEEISEFKRTVSSGEYQKVEEELGDLLFAIVNYARFLKVNPESALNKSIEKFIRRFKYIELKLRENGKDIHNSTLEEMDRLWEESKRVV
jgi:MazG family protein